MTNMTIKSILESFDEKFPDLRITSGNAPAVYLPNAPRNLIKSFLREQLTNLLNDMPVEEKGFVFNELGRAKIEGYNEHCKKLVEWRKNVLSEIKQYNNMKNLENLFYVICLFVGWVAIVGAALSLFIK